MGDRNTGENVAIIRLQKNKKAQIFTVFAIVLIILIFVSFGVYSEIYKRGKVKTRISTMESFISSIEKNLERQTYIAGYRIFFLAGVHMTSSGKYIDVDEFFNEAFFNGTINGTENEFLAGVNYPDLMESLTEKSDKISVIITLTNPTIEIEQEDPWNVRFTLTSDLVVEDKAGLASWTRQQVISSVIPIEGFEDPLFAIKTYTKVPRKIVRTPYESNYVTAGGDSTNLQNHISGKYYAANPNAPSFLNRLEGNFSSDINGIESFVVIPDLSLQGLQTYEKSCVDYIYFSSSNPSYSSVSTLPSWFRIDDENNRRDFYNITLIP